MKFDFDSVQKKQKRLDEITVELKQELFGIDPIIDRVINLIRVWYIMPELITRPVIVNLWGMTGVGKTQLVRSLSKKLGFNDRYVEVQMDGFANVSSSFSANSINGILEKSSIQEGQPGILLLDEMQRFRTINEDGQEMKVERFQDVWMLLSDGKFSLNAEIFHEIEMMIAMRNFSADAREEDDDDNAPVSKKKKNAKPPHVRKFKIYPYEAQSIKTKLKRTESLDEIMQWSKERVHEALMEFHAHFQDIEVDFTKLLVFISGNLDEMFKMAGDISNADTDADVFHEYTKKLGPNEVKEALAERFKPEQIARMGSNNLIYPSLNRDTYERIIRNTCETYMVKIRDLTGLHVELYDSVYPEIYNNSVYPTQGTRPVFSAIHQILGSALSVISMWAFEHKIRRVGIALDATKQVLTGIDMEETNASIDVPILLELNTLRKKTSEDLITMIAVHEAGHALLYSLLKGVPPMETRLNLTSSSKSGYVIPAMNNGYSSAQDIRDQIVVYYGGTVAEELVFGKENRSNGAQSDMIYATNQAAVYVRQYGFGSRLGVIMPDDECVIALSGVDSTNEEISEILEIEKQRAVELILGNKDILIRIADTLIEKKVISAVEFKALVPEFKLRDEIQAFRPGLWEKFKRKTKEKA